eukprot:TRINITY_DN4936_c0_g2_i1.p1 TRINITY_DN4936_c0_g2~~TRINITY_DN4936_c0_g2_i1.p1  ORF type:complete len:163 (-),score=25.29 TRINITY_DN4936_c0_g2_i1:58-546(-)
MDPGYVDLWVNVEKKSVDILNKKGGDSSSVFTGGAPLESDVDGQLLINLSFTHAVKIHSFCFHAPEENGPKSIRLFVNTQVDFDGASQNPSAQDLVLTKENLSGTPVLTKFVKFQSVNTLTIFVVSNIGGTDCTRIDSIKIFGAPKDSFNMSELKKVEGHAH